MRVNGGGFLDTFQETTLQHRPNFFEAFETLPLLHPGRYSDGSIPREMNRANPWRTATQGGYDFSTSSKRFRLYFL